MNNTNLSKRNHALMVFSLFILIIIHVQIPVDGLWFSVKLILGLFGLLFLPGFSLATITLDEADHNIFFSFILGFMLQLINIYVVWIFHIFYGPVNFALLIYVLTLIEVISIIAVSYKRRLMLNINKIFSQFKLDPVLVVVIILYLFLAFYWQQWATAPHSDGSTYLDLARNVVETGRFQSNMIFPNNTWNYTMYSSGALGHMFGYFAIAFFFMLGNVSLFSAKVMLIFVGLLTLVVLYALTKKIFSLNVARFAVFITAISSELLTHVGLVGGPEIPSALFSLFTIFLLFSAATSKRKISTALIAGLSLFIVWYAWEFNFLVMLAFLPLLFIYIATMHNEFKLMDLIWVLVLLVSFILEWRVLLNFTRITVGVNIPSLIVVVFIAIYFLRLKKSQNRNILVTFTLLFVVLYLMFYSRVIAVNVIPQLQQFGSSVLPGIKLVTENIASDVSTLSRAFNLDLVSNYWTLYWDGVCTYVGTVTVFLAFISLVKLNKFKETLLFLSFPMLQAILWSLFVTIDMFQPRFILCTSLFYFVLVASIIEMLYSNALESLRKLRMIQSKNGGE